MNEENPGVVFDGHCDTPSRIMPGSGFRLDERNSEGHIDIPRMKEGGLTAQFFACCIDPDFPRKKWETLASDNIREVKNALSELEEAEIVLSGSGVTEAVAGGKIAIMLSVEGGHVIPSVSSLEKFHEMGMRSLAVTWKTTNDMADSSEGRKRWGGLSGFGREIIMEMDRLGIVIDCSHSSRETFYDILDISSNPVMLSHSCAAGICDIPRNTDDGQMKALEENGGVICINFFPAFLDRKTNVEIMDVWSVYRREKSSLARRYGHDPKRAGSELLPAAMRKLNRLTMPGLSAVADHIDYAVDVAGIEHVGLGSDFDGIPVTPAGLEDVSMLPALKKELSERGYSDQDLGRIMGRNLLRVVRSVCG